MNVLKELKKNAKIKLYEAQADALEKAHSELWGRTRDIENEKEFPGREDVLRKLSKELDRINKKACKLRGKEHKCQRG